MLILILIRNTVKQSPVNTFLPHFRHNYHGVWKSAIVICHLKTIACAYELFAKLTICKYMWRNCHICDMLRTYSNGRIEL